tara:strand:- start:2698 stop:3813 length:1116 start_codon:yes stop_codon:yes gene_type:complete
LTNIGIAGLLIYLSAFHVLFSPIGGTIIFISCFILAFKRCLNIKQVFLIVSYTVALEVVFHTHYLGWDAGYYYYLYALSVVFLLDFSWRISTVIIFNGTMILLTAILAVVYMGEGGAFTITADFTAALNTLNLAVICILILIIMITSSHTNKLKDKALKLANQELEQQNKEILEQRNHLEILLKEVHHRVKNNLQIISSLISLQQNSIKNEQMVSILDESKKRVEAIALIHQNLYNNNTGSEVDFNAYLTDLVNSQQIIQSNIQCNIKSEDLILELDIAVPLGIIISEMITNSVKHAFKGVKNPTIEITLIYNENNNHSLTYRDNGIGLPLDFKLDDHQSLGMEIIAALTEQIDAKVSYYNDNGAVFNVSF